MARTRLREPEARDLALQLAAASPNGEISTAKLKEKIGEMIVFTPIDLQPSTTRPGERKWQQIVGNVVSHKDANTSLFKRGLAERLDDGLRITAAGRASVLKKQG